MMRSKLVQTLIGAFALSTLFACASVQEQSPLLLPLVSEEVETRAAASPSKAATIESDSNILENTPFVPFGPALPPEMERLSIGTVKWLDRETAEFTDDDLISTDNPNGTRLTLSLKNNFRDRSPSSRDITVYWSMMRDLWPTRGIRIGETRRFYPTVGLLTVQDNDEIRWSYYIPFAQLNADGSPAPPVGHEGGLYIIQPAMPEYLCFWHQVSYYPKSIDLNFPLPDMHVIEQCLISAGVTPNIAFSSTKEAMALSDTEEAIRRARSN
jgi:hypothetical protein